MVSADGARTIVGVIGNIISFGLFLSPMPTFFYIIKKRSTEEFSPFPYLATFLNCMMWVFYGTDYVHPHSLLVITINGIGMGLEMFYIAIFFAFGNNRQRLRVVLILVVEFIFMGVVIALVIIFANTLSMRQMIVGILCIIFGTCMYGSPLVVMKKVITTKSVQYMPLYLSLASFLNGVCWTAYALIKFDLFMVIPNGMGALFGAAQLILYACFCRSTPKEDAALAVQMSPISAVP